MTDINPTASEVENLAGQAEPTAQTTEQAATEAAVAETETATQGAEVAQLETVAEMAVIPETETLAEEPAEVTPAIEERVVESTETAMDAPVDLLKTKAQLTDELAHLLSEQPVQAIREQAEALKAEFYRQHRAEHEAERRAFLATGGTEEAFVPAEDAQELRFKELYNDYRTRRNEYAAQQERSKEENLTRRQQIIEELKMLIDSSETLGATFNTFRELQTRWKEAGAVPTAAQKDLWESYHLQVENFYNYVKINKELRDLDLRKNLEVKTELADQAEALAAQEGDVIGRFARLQELHDLWREVGPVAAEAKDALWERFKEASAVLNKAHQAHFQSLKDEQTANRDRKNELSARVEAIAANTYTSRKEWDAASEEIFDIQRQWREVGFAPKKDNVTIFERFRRACDVFFERKRAFFSSVKGEMDANLMLKRRLCEAAEALADSTEWKEATEGMIELQRKWKEIGAVSRRHSDAIWKRFRAAADKFFTRKSAHFAEQGGERNDALTAKRALIAEINEAVAIDFDVIKEFQRRWNELGHVPFKVKEAVQKEYKTAMDRLFGVVRGSGGGSHGSSHGAGFGGSHGAAASGDRGRMMSRVRQLEATIATLENNIGFFGNSKGAELLRRDVEQKIEHAKAEMTELIGKIKETE